MATIMLPELDDPANTALGDAALEACDWSRLHHAYGRAVDTPEHLRALLGNDAVRIKAALAHLTSAIIHQGTPWTATAPTVRVLAGYLMQGRLALPVRAAVLDFLGEVAEPICAVADHVEALRAMSTAVDLAAWFDRDDDEALYEDEEAANAIYAQALLDGLRTGRIMLAALLDGLRHEEAAVRVAAMPGIAELASLDALKEGRQEAAACLRELAARAADQERCACVLALGELAAPVEDYLRDASPAVRVCAAMSPALAASPAALDVLLDAWRQADRLDTWFQPPPPQFTLRPRIRVLNVLLERVEDFASLVDGAVAMLSDTSKYLADPEWGRLLAKAFPAGEGIIRNEAQCRYLAALTANEALWDPRYGNARLWFERAGLPYDREACVAQAAAASASFPRESP